MKLVATAAGIVLILVGMYDIFRTLFLPSGKGLVSKWVAHGVWKCARTAASRRSTLLSLAGPVAFVMTALVWWLIISSGFALVYWAFMPAGFSYSPGLLPGQNMGLLDAYYLSVVTIATLGFGDITPADDWLRVLTPLEAILGFLLFTATISWLLSIYPDLSRRQTFAREVSLMRRAEALTSIDPIAFNNSELTVRLLSKLTSEIVGIRGDLLQFPVTYYFHESQAASSLPVVMPYVLELARRASQNNQPSEVRFYALRLQGALDDLAETLAARFLFVPHEPAQQVFANYARDHLHHTA